MQNYVLSPIDPEILINQIAKQVTANVLSAFDARSKQFNTIEPPIGLDEAVQLTGWSKPTIYAKTSKNEIPFFRKGRRLFFFRSELIDYITEGRQLTKDQKKAEVLNSLKK